MKIFLLIYFLILIYQKPRSLAVINYFLRHVCIKYLFSCRLIPVPMVGFKELLRRLKVQDQMTKQHQTRLDVSFLSFIMIICSCYC